MAGDGAPCPEPSGLKAHRAVVQAVSHPPAAGLKLAMAVRSLNWTKPMSIQTALRPRKTISPETAAMRLEIQARKSDRARRRLRQLQEAASAEIEKLIALMDALDGYSLVEAELAVDDEPCDDDELEGQFTSHNGQVVPTQSHDPAGDLEADGSDDEPSLGSVNSCWGQGSQVVWASGAGIDLEDSGLGNDDREHDPLDGGEDDSSDDEPSLGWTVDGSLGGHCDYELREHAQVDVVKDRARRRKGKRKVHTIDISQSVTGRWRISGLSPQQRAALDR